MKSDDGSLWILQDGVGKESKRRRGESDRADDSGQQWVLYCAADEREVLYYVHDNGGRPFMVRVSPRLFAVYRISHVDNKEQLDLAMERYKDEHFAHEDCLRSPQNPPPQLFTELIVGPAPYARVLAAEDHEAQSEREREFGMGNAVLIQTLDPAEDTAAEFIFVGWQVQRFAPNDQILSFQSHIAGSDVAYPVAIGAENTYLLVNRRYIANTNRAEGQNAYSQYFSKTSGKPRIVNGVLTTQLEHPNLDDFPPFDLTLIHARM